MFSTISIIIVTFYSDHVYRGVKRTNLHDTPPLIHPSTLPTLLLTTNPRPLCNYIEVFLYIPAEYSNFWVQESVLGKLCLKLFTVLHECIKKLGRPLLTPTLYQYDISQNIRYTNIILTLLSSR